MKRIQLIKLWKSSTGNQCYFALVHNITNQSKIEIYFSDSHRSISANTSTFGDLDIIFDALSEKEVQIWKISK